MTTRTTSVAISEKTVRRFNVTANVLETLILFSLMIDVIGRSSPEAS
jgi:hypothetical protein